LGLKEKGITFTVGILILLGVTYSVIVL